MTEDEKWGARFDNVQVNIPARWGSEEKTHMALGGLAQFALEKLGLIHHGRVDVNMVVDKTVKIGELRMRTEESTAIVGVHPSQTWRFRDETTVTGKMAEAIAGAAAVAMYQRTRLYRPPPEEIATIRSFAKEIVGDEIKRIRQEIASERDSS